MPTNHMSPTAPLVAAHSTAWQTLFPSKHLDGYLGMFLVAHEMLGWSASGHSTFKGRFWIFLNHQHSSSSRRDGATRRLRHPDQW
jgi:hypothetical protein